MHSSGVHSCNRWMEDGYSAGTHTDLTYLHNIERGVLLDK